MAPWKDVGGTYALDYGHIIPHESYTKRGFIKNIMGNFDKTKSGDITLRMGHPGQIDRIYRDDRSDYELVHTLMDCILLHS